MDYGPKNLETFIGQKKLKERIRIHIRSALERQMPLEHVLLLAEPGFGKTTLAALIAEEMCVEYISYVMPIKEVILKRIVQQFDGIVLFDEIHRLSTKQQENLLPLLSPSGYLQLDNGRRIEPGYLTIIGATTEPQNLISPLIQRFPIGPESGLLFEQYTNDEMATIVYNLAAQFNIELTWEQANILGKATGGIPRRANALISMARDLNSTDVNLILEKCGISCEGLTELHFKYMQALYDCGGESGLENITSYVNLPKSTIVGIETFLVKRGIVERAKTGRILLPKGDQILKERIK